MTELVIRLNAGYNVPHAISNLNIDEWQIVLEFISELLIKHDSINIKISENELHRKLESKYADIISSKIEQHEKQLKENTELKHQLSNMREELEAQNAINIKKANMSKDIIINSLQDQIQELKKHLDSITAQRIAPLQEQYDKLQKETATMKAALEAKYTEQYDKLQKETAAMKSAAETKHEEQFDKLQKETAAMKAALEARHTEQYDKLQKETAAMKSAAEIKHEEQISKYRVMLNEQQIAFNNILHEEKQRIETKYEEQHKEHIGIYEQRNKELLAQLEHQRSAHESQHASYDQRNRELANTYDLHVKELTARYEQQHIAYDQQHKEYTKLFEQRNKDLVTQLEYQRVAYEQQHANYELRSKELNTQLEQQRASYEQQIEQRSKELATIYEQRSKELTITYEQRNKELHTQLEYQRVTYEQQHANYELRSKELNTQLEQQRASYEQQIEQRSKELANTYELRSKELTITYEQQIEQRSKELVANYDLRNKELAATYEQRSKELSNTYEQRNKELSVIHEQQRATYELRNKELHTQLEQQRADLLTQLEQRRAELQQCISAHQVELCNLHTEYNKQTALAIEQATKTTNEQAEQRIAKKIAELNEQHQASNALQDNIMRTLEPITRYYGGTNTEKGNSGEAAIDLLLSEYKDARITDTSAETSAGDLLFSWKNLRCLIEVKNKKEIVADDITKFEKDIRTQMDKAQAKKINCAMFISLQSDRLPNRSRELLQLEYYNGVPVIYSYMPPPSKDIYYAIACLDKIVQNIENTDGLQEEIKQYCNKYCKDSNELKKYFAEELRDAYRRVKTLTKQYERYAQLCEELAPIHAKINNTTDQEEQEEQSDASSVTQDHEEHIRQFAAEYIRQVLRNQLPTTKSISEACDIPSTTVDAVLFKKIINHARITYLQSVINKEKAKQICDFFTANGRYPIQKELIGEKILTEHSTRLLSKVIKSKDFSTIIGEYSKMKIVE